MTIYAYVVCFGERCEGHDPVAAHATLDDALKDAERLYGVRPTHVGGVQWLGTLANGVDEVLVRRFSVRGAR